ncbi:hypothetical protein FHG64_13105 [Antarcticibacterium flavum]|uniref:Potassium channel domain-containing protein n=1 Tax=Antarcticibacterium flavum TaxID=2058175 RepID=A0A5B7X597_9FLAO|nr:MULTISPECIES: ion channel [Antarcticibacterium]MCM4158517.1 hypothetical protein [Antarcticibacterium sp. W02-3]QCY70265.1 hypothetical protein FHG64_13105 [Antarcticibacterium flavum]
MIESLYLAAGIIILILVIYDFFFTTLSASGMSFIANGVSIFSDRLIQFAVRVVGRKVYNYHGLFVNLMILSVWVILAWLGLFLLYSSNPEMITNSSGRVANGWERLYFTGYTLSTLGIGNFKPVSGVFEIVTSLFAFFGFVFFTSSMTYFISVSSAVVTKRTLVKSIYNLGKNPEEIAHNFLSLDSSYTYQQFLALQEMVDRHAVNHHAYPVVHFYTQAKAKNCLSLNLARLDEAFSILLGSDDAENLHQELKPLRSALTNFIQTLDTKFSSSLPKIKNSVDPSFFNYSEKVQQNTDLESRRKILQRLLKSEGFGWEDVV